MISVIITAVYITIYAKLFTHLKSKSSEIVCHQRIVNKYLSLNIESKGEIRVNIL